MTKKITLFVLFLVMCTTGTLKAQPQSTFINACYSVAGGLESEQYLKTLDVGQFRFHYIMAAPNWVAEDFDLPYDTIYKKYVEDHSYGTTRVKQGLVPDFIAAIHKVGSKVLVSFPGDKYIQIAIHPARLAKFTRMMADFAAKYDYDGLELDWEHTVTIPLHTEFMRLLRAELDKQELATGKTKFLTTALHSSHRYSAAEAKTVSQYVDWLNIMTYDMGGGIWGKVPTHNTPLADMKRELAYWNVFSPEKITIGLASYGFYYQGIQPLDTVAAGKNLGDYGRYCNYNELPALLKKGWTERWDDVNQCPIYVSPKGDEWMTLDSPRSLRAKIDWVLAQKYKGVFWWVMNSDLVPAAKGDKFSKHLLMDEVSEWVKPYAR